MSDQPVPRYVSVGRLEPEGEFCLTLDRHGLIIARNTQEVMEHLAELINDDYAALDAERQLLLTKLQAAEWANKTLCETYDPHP